MVRGLRVLSVGPLIALLLLVSNVDSATRINGNQMLEGSAYHNAASAASVPSTIVYNLGQAMLPTSGLSDSSSGVSFGVGLGYDIGQVVYTIIACPVSLTGDVNESGDLTSADIIAMVNYVFKGGAAPQPCEAAADVNGSGSVTSADIIFMVGHVFKGGAAPQDVCTLIPGTWSCP